MTGMEAPPAEANEALHLLRRGFPDSLLAVYLHGSAVAGGLRPDSDVDLLAIVARPIPHALRKDLLAGLMEISGRPGERDGKRPLELIVFLRADLDATAYPARSEFVYGEWQRTRFEAGAVPEPESDPEYTLLLAQARREARPLVGPAAAHMLPAVSGAEIRRAVKDALPSLLDTLEGDERNVLLTLARMWRTLSTGDFVSKDAAAEWAMARLPAAAAATIGRARQAYLGLARDDWRDRREEARRAAGELSARVTAMLR